MIEYKFENDMDKELKHTFIGGMALFFSAAALLCMALFLLIAAL